MAKKIYIILSTSSTKQFVVYIILVLEIRTLKHYTPHARQFDPKIMQSQYLSNQINDEHANNYFQKTVIL